MKNKLFLPCVIVCALLSCRKSEDTPAPKTYMSFTMNGTGYTFDVSKFSASSPAAGNCRILSAVNFGTSTGAETDFPYWFDIRKSSSGVICATLMPKEFPIPFIDSLGDCNFKIPTADINGNPLSIEKVFFYELGTLTYSKSNCGKQDYFDIYCLCTLNADFCDINGTFNLTFKNGLGESITLADGKFLQTSAFQ